MQKIEIARTDFMEVKVVLDQDNITYAEVKNFDTVGDPVVIGRGKARWNPIDHFDPEIGHQIALGRALEKFGRKLAAYNERLAVSEGQHKRNIKDIKKDLRLVERVNRSYEAWKGIQEQFEKTLQQPTKGPEREETTVVDSNAVEDLAEVENRNKAKLLGNEESTQNNATAS